MLIHYSYEVTMFNAAIFGTGMEPELIQISCSHKHTEDILGGSSVTLSSVNNATTGSDLQPKYGQSDKMLLYVSSVF